MLCSYSHILMPEPIDHHNRSIIIRDKKSFSKVSDSGRSHMKKMSMFRCFWNMECGMFACRISKQKNVYQDEEKYENKFFFFWNVIEQWAFTHPESDSVGNNNNSDKKREMNEKIKIEYENKTFSESEKLSTLFASRHANHLIRWSVACILILGRKSLSYDWNLTLSRFEISNRVFISFCFVLLWIA